MAFVKRVNREVIELYRHHRNIKVEYSITQIKVNVTISEDESKIIQFVMCTMYPFRAFNVFINDVPYSRTLRMPSPRFTRIGNKLKLKCLCCNTILCSWGPIYTMQSIIDEIAEHSVFKKNVVYYAIIEELSRQTSVENKCFAIAGINSNILSYLIHEPDDIG